MIAPTDKQIDLVKRIIDSNNRWRRRRWLLWLLLVIPFLILVVYYIFRSRKRKVITTQAPMPAPPPQPYYYNQQYQPGPQQGYNMNDLPPQPTPAYVPPGYENTSYGQQHQGTYNGYQNDEFNAPSGPPPKR